MRSPAFLLALAAAASTGGCAATVATAAVGAAALQWQDRPLGQGIDDASGAAVIRAKLLRGDSSAYLRVGVEMSGGHVVLTGSVPTMDHRALAEREAWSVASVQQVSNELQVGPRTGLWRSTMDEMLGARVRAQFVADGRIKAINYNIDAYKGVVYLMGVARSEDELRLAAETASVTPGARQVISYVVVRGQPAPTMSLATERRQEPPETQTAEIPYGEEWR